MSPEAETLLRRAGQHLQSAKTNAESETWDVVGVFAYSAAFHAAQAYVLERTGLRTKTHNGLKSELNRAALVDERIDRALVHFFGGAETMRHEAIYGETELTDDAATFTLAWAEAFVAEVERVIA